MPGHRGLALVAAGAALWVAGRLIGSPALDAIGIGLAVVPIAALAFARASRGRLTAERRLSARRTAPGQTVTINLRIRNASPAATPMLLLEDALPPGLGRPSRMVLPGIPARREQAVSYAIRPGARGRYPIGPLVADAIDPLAITHARLELAPADDLIVVPVVEELAGAPPGPLVSAHGASASRFVLRSGEEFSTIRSYQVGDDLRRIHWPSTARMGKVMIRRDEATRRSTACVFVDTRRSALGRTGGAAFETAISAAATIGMFLARAGFTLRLVTPEYVAAATEDSFLESLAVVGDSAARTMHADRLRSAAVGGSTLAIVTAPPPPDELAVLTRVGAAFGPRIAVLVPPVDPASLSPDRRTQMEGRQAAARSGLGRAGWDVYLVEPGGSLKSVWNANKRAPVAGGF